MPSPVAQPPLRSGPVSAGPYLLVGDAAQLEQAVREAVGPAASVATCESWFDALGHLTRASYSAVFVPAEPVQRRAEEAMAALREAAGVTAGGEATGAATRLITVARPAHEGLARRLTRLGCDDYLVLPATAMDVGAVLLVTPVTKPAATQPAPAATAGSPVAPASTVVPSPSGPFTLAGLVVAEILLEALVREPQSAASAALRELNARLPVGARLELLKVADRDPAVPPGMTLLSRVLRTSSARASERGEVGSEVGGKPEEEPGWVLHLFLSEHLDEVAADAFLEQVAVQMTRLLDLEARHCRLQKLAITDELTGVYNARYFKHFLERTLAKAREGRFPVTLLVFDIDSFKTYNDSYGHSVGDEILRQTARMIRRCVRDHDMVARLGGDEFAVVFWEKDGPRQVLGNATSKPVSHRPPQSPVQVFERFKRMIAGHDFAALGPSGRGTLTISGGLAVFPYDAQTADELICAADKALMFGAKRGGKNTIHLVGQGTESQS